MRARTCCPFCGSERVELVSQFGSQLMTSQLRCAACGSYFEGLRSLGEEEQEEGQEQDEGV